MAKYKYQLFIPCGNKTALVLGTKGLETNMARRKEIQDAILARHKDDDDGEIEQVGFISTSGEPKLIMTGGEFCGNATRCAASYYLQKSGKGELKILVSGTSRPVRAGVSTNGASVDSWTEMPLIEDVKESVTPLMGGCYWVVIDGISHLVVPQAVATAYISRILSCDDKEEQKKIAIDFFNDTIKKNFIVAGSAYGIMFLESIADVVKMHPFVHVAEAGTTYYETACGSGTICVGLVSSMLQKKSISLPLLQPSGEIIYAEVNVDSDGVISKSRIVGNIKIGLEYEI